MSTRPVLSMNFYEATQGSYSNPYSEMVKQAQLEKQQQQTTKKNVIKDTMKNLTEAVEHFFPEDNKAGKESNSNKVWVKNNRTHSSGPYHFNKDYFDQIDNNLKSINSYLDLLDKEA